MTDNTNDRAREIEQKMRDSVKRQQEEREATPSGRIRKRIADLQKGPESKSFELVYDKERSLWLGEQEYWEGESHDPVAAEGATPAEVLRKLAELME